MFDTFAWKVIKLSMLINCLAALIVLSFWIASDITAQNLTSEQANLALIARPSTSFVSGHETLSAINDGFTPAHSDDKSTVLTVTGPEPVLNGFNMNGINQSQLIKLRFIGLTIPVGSGCRKVIAYYIGMAINLCLCQTQKDLEQKKINLM